ncbi:hypothetical protein A3A20_00020 [Candidatus Wolfebacteria bacterium RIFCSPLOWO2_01_FULL_45_19]|uniref:Proteasome endopeptidase complex n=1 Tax=Candidatus Wolfebacteria bacterium RIFCSPLOWO2_01_FULL_45_19 TaxID=1802557 RepID=A0A1F8DQF9_9BACT|nr:MAG: hypothetical protein A3A20_00020 [Candidatus Wolfebacteria bacterium RIFCSPLOWO2_01_FULL_45_19]
MKKFASEEFRERIETRLGKVLRPQTHKNARRSNTVILALKYRDGVILAADRRTTTGDHVYSDTSNKITKLSPFSAVGHSGTCAAINWIMEIYKLELDALRAKAQEEIPLANQVRLFSNIVSIVSSILPDDFYSYFLMVGFDEIKKRTAIIEIDWYLGDKFPHKSFGAIGSGSPEALGVLKDWFLTEQRTIQETDEKQALRVTLKALKAAAGEVHVSPPELSPPNIVIFTDKDCHSLSEDEVEKLFGELKFGRRRK